MSNSEIKYSIVFENGRVEEGWIALQAEFPDRVTECKEFLINHPEDRRKALGILKKLKGRFKGILQYDITKNDARVWYRVDRRNRLVII